MKFRLSETLIPLSVLTTIFGILVGLVFQDFFEGYFLYSFLGLGFVFFVIGVVSWIKEYFTPPVTEATRFAKIIKIISFIIYVGWLVLVGLFINFAANWN